MTRPCIVQHCGHPAHARSTEGGIHVCRQHVPLAGAVGFVLTWWQRVGAVRREKRYDVADWRRERKRDE